MRILQMIAGFGSGGAETLVKDLSIGLKSKGQIVKVVILDQFNDEPTIIKKVDELKEFDIQTVFLGREPGKMTFGVFAKLKKLLNEFQPDVVHFHSDVFGLYLTPFIISKKQIKWIRTFHSSSYKMTRINYPLRVRLVNNQIQKIYCSTEASEKLINVLGEGQVISNGIGKMSFSDKRKELIKELGLKDDSKIILAVGRLAIPKNQFLLPEILKELGEEYHLILVGSIENNEIKEPLINKISKYDLGQRFHLLGIRTDVFDWMYSADLFISTSIYEGLPMTGLEAMNCGVKMLLSPIEEHTKVFENQPGVIVAKENNAESFIKAIKGINWDYDKEEMIDKRKKFIREYSMDQKVEEHLNFYNEIN